MESGQGNRTQKAFCIRRHKRFRNTHADFLDLAVEFEGLRDYETVEKKVIIKLDYQYLFYTGKSQITIHGERLVGIHWTLKM